MSLLVHLWGSEGEKMIFGGALDPQTRALVSRGASSFFLKSNTAEKKKKKVTKSGPITDGGGGTKIDLVSRLFACEVVVWRRQLTQMCAFVDPRDKRGAP